MTVSLLKSVPSDAKELVRQALDVLVPALPRRLPVKDYVAAIRYTRKALHDSDVRDQSGAFQGQHAALYALCQHPLLFYPYRKDFIAPLCSLLHRLANTTAQGSSSSTGADPRAMGLQVADLLITWEVHRRDRTKAPLPPTPANKRPLPMSAPSAPSPPPVALDSAEASAKRVKLEDGSAAPTEASAASGGGGGGGGGASSSQRPPLTPSPPPSSSSAAASARAGAGAVDDETSLCSQPMYVELVLSFLVKLAILSAADVKDNKDPAHAKTCARCLALLRSALYGLANTTCRLNFFEKVIIHRTRTTQTKDGWGCPEKQ